MKSYIVVLAKIMMRIEKKFGILVPIVSFYISFIISVGLYAPLSFLKDFLGANEIISVLISYLIFSPSIFLSIVSALLFADEFFGYVFKRGLFYSKPGEFKSALARFVGE